jgi:hypothetical protein
LIKKKETYGYDFGPKDGGFIVEIVPAKYKLTKSCVDFEGFFEKLTALRGQVVIG